jgi:hypothetical protein
VNLRLLGVRDLGFRRAPCHAVPLVPGSAEGF